MNRCGFRTFVAAGEGFEPSHTESESAVLPLHKPAIFVRSCRTNRYYYTGKQEFVKGFLKKIIFVDFSRFQGIFPGKPPLRVHHQKQISLFRKWDPAQSLRFLLISSVTSAQLPSLYLRDFVLSCTEEIWTWIVIRLLEWRVAVFSAHVWTVCLTFFQRWFREDGRASRICATGVQFFLYGYLPAAVI